MNRRQKIIISVTGIFLVLLILVGLTYAYFLTQIQGNENNTSITVTTANLILEYGDGNGILETDKLEPSNDFISFKDSQGNSVPSKIFTVTNKGNATVEGYKVYLENVQNQLERKDDLVYTLSCKSYINYGETNQAESGTCTGVSTETTFPSVITSIVSNDINVGVTHVYELKVKYKEMGVDQSVDMNKLVTAKINIYDSTTKFLAREIMDNALSTPATNKTLYIEPSLQDGTTYTIPAHATTKENERILTYTMDDYGTSYYYRGNVEDNYVNYAGMCWRIVRIEGDGSVKLLLEDRYEQCNDKEGQDLNNNGTYFTGNWSGGEDDYYVFGYDNNRADFINYEGGLADSFKTFQTSKLTSTDIEKLKVDEWCFDHNVTSTNEYCYDWDEDGVDDKCYTDEYYGAYTRIYTNKKPLLSCSGTKLTEFKDETDMYVGTLTADEMSFAGAYSSTNYNYYLMNKYAKDNILYWWSLSPGYFNGEYGNDSAFLLSFDGYLSGDGSVSDDSYSRPAVSLKSGSVITEGVGTLENPYVIE